MSLAADDDDHDRPEIEDGLVADDLEVAEKQDPAEGDQKNAPENRAGGDGFGGYDGFLFLDFAADQGPAVDPVGHVHGIDDLEDVERSQDDSGERLGLAVLLHGDQSRRK